MEDLGDKILAKDINGTWVTIPKTKEISGIHDLEMKCAMVGFSDAIGCLSELKSAMDKSGITYERNPSVVAEFLRRVK